MRIKLYNRDGASIYLYRNDNAIPIESNIYRYKLTVDSKHKYVLKYCRIIYEKGFYSDIIAIDPSGGPMLSLGDTFESKKYKIVKINSINSILISENKKVELIEDFLKYKQSSERNNNNKEYT